MQVSSKTEILSSPLIMQKSLEKVGVDGVLYQSEMSLSKIEALTLKL